MPTYLDPRDNERYYSTKGYEKSKYQNLLAEIANRYVMEGAQEDTIYSGEDAAFDLVRLDLLDDGTSDVVILRYDSQGFISVEWDGSPLSWQVNGQRHWDYLRAEYEREEEED